MPSRAVRKPPIRSDRCWRRNGAWPPRCRCWPGTFSRPNAPRRWPSSAAKLEAGNGWRSPSPTCSRSPTLQVLRPIISRAPWPWLTRALNYPAAPRNRSKPKFLFRTEQPDPRRLDPFGLCREFSPRLGFIPDSELAPRLGFFPASFLDPSQLLIFSLLIAAPFSPLLTTIAPPPFRGPLHVGVPRLGGLFGVSRLGGSSLLRRRCLGHGSRGLRRRNCRL